MTVNVKQMLAAGRFQTPNEDECRQLQAYWDELTAQGLQLHDELGAAEPAMTFAAWRNEDD